MKKRNVIFGGARFLFVHRIYFGPTVIAYSRCEPASRTRVCEINFARVYFRLREERYGLSEGKGSRVKIARETYKSIR